MVRRTLAAIALGSQLLTGCVSTNQHPDQGRDPFLTQEAIDHWQKKAAAAKEKRAKAAAAVKAPPPTGATEEKPKPQTQTRPTPSKQKRYQTPPSNMPVRDRIRPFHSIEI